MRVKLVIIYISLFIAGCKSKEVVPGNILSQKKMQSLLWDMMRADQFLADYVLNKDTSLNKKIESIKLYQQVLAINQVSKEKFEQSFSFYKSHPLLLKIIMDSIVNISPEKTIDTIKSLPAADSLKKALDSVMLNDTIAKDFRKQKRLRLQSTNLPL